MAAQKGQLVLIGFHIPKGANPALPSTAKEYVAYPVDWAALADGASTQGKVQIDANYDFVWLETAHSSGHGAAHVPMKIQITPNGGRPVFREPVYLNTVSAADTATISKKTPVPTVYKTTQTIRVDFYA